jgi:hypothetical protein
LTHHPQDDMNHRITHTIRIAAALAASLVAGGAGAQDAKLAAAYEGTWRNLEAPANGTMSLVKLSVAADGTVSGTYIRDARRCSTDGAPLTGRFSGNMLQFTVDFGSDFPCKGTAWSFTLQPDGALNGTGNSAFSLAATLQPAK